VPYPQNSFLTLLVQVVGPLRLRADVQFAANGGEGASQLIRTNVSVDYNLFHILILPNCIYQNTQTEYFTATDSLHRRRGLNFTSPIRFGFLLSKYIERVH
jgi:hypothetical protein